MNRKGRILIVDDEKSVCDLLSHELGQAGYAVAAVTSGREAIERARIEQPDVMLVDLIMEDMPGLAVMTAVAKVCPDTQCIVITGHAPESSAIAATTLAAYAYLLKPVNIALLDLTIRKAMEHAAVKKARRQTGEALRALMQRIDGPVLLLDSAGRIVELNARAAALLGAPREKLLGEPAGVAGGAEVSGLGPASVAEAAAAGCALRVTWRDGSAGDMEVTDVSGPNGTSRQYLIRPVTEHGG
ncbi:MAG: response regulator [Lentisphaerae bacterium]|nr:response regulator [Lentisphaerota bacterium]